MASKFSAKEKKAWKEAKQEEQRQMIEDAVQNVASAKGWQDWIRFGRNNLKRYSLQNALLIHMQLPTATLTKGRMTWLKEGHQINDDAKPISILAPQMVNRVDPDGNVMYGDNGKPMKRVGWYRVVSVYDVSHTSAANDPLPKKAYVELSGDDFVNLVPRLEGFARELGFFVRYHEGEQRVDEQLHEIWLDAKQPVNQIVYSLVKILAREYGDINEVDYADESGMVIVESAACLALGQLGFDTREATIPFLAATDESLNDFRSFAYTVEDIANTLAAKMGK